MSTRRYKRKIAINTQPQKDVAGDKYRRLLSILDIVFHFYFLFQLLRLWIAPDPFKAESLIASFTSFIVFEFLMLPYNLFVGVFGRAFGMVFSILFYGVMLVGILNSVEFFFLSFVYVLFILNRIIRIFMNTVKAERKIHLLYTSGIFFFLLFFLGIFSFLIPRFGLTEEFLNSIDYVADGTKPHYVVCLLLIYYLSAMVIDYKLKRKFKREQFVENG
ncbi:MAG: hypothetical protein LUH22_07185 [Bacteroides sp.]|nr:hypothetical protein [Bacteroides sp.]